MSHVQPRHEPATSPKRWFRKVVLHILTKTQEKWHPPQASSPADAACQAHCGFNSRWEDNKRTFFMRRQLEGMGNLRKRVSRCWRLRLKTVREENPVGLVRCTLQRKRSKRRDETQQLEWWDVFVKWRVALVDSRPIRAQDIDLYKAAWCLFSSLLFCSSGSAASLPV